MKKQSILSWFEERQQDSGLEAKLSDKPLQEPWEVHPDSPRVIQRCDRRFFAVENVEVANAHTREVDEWTQPMIAPADSVESLHGQKIAGIILLLRRKFNSRMQFLVQAKAEPGNDTFGGVLLAPTLQASAANLRAHRSEVPFYSELNEAMSHVGEQEPDGFQYAVQPKDGGRFFRSNNLLLMQEVEKEKKHTIELPETHIWATRAAIRELQKKGLVNEHLNEVLGVLA